MSAKWRHPLTMLKLYHGTNTTFDKIELDKCLPYKDFGRGFYLTSIRQQAMGRACDKCAFEGGTPAILTFLFDEKELESLNVKRFEGTNAEWAKFILANRNRRLKQHHNYDVVIGPVADDGVINSIRLYETKVIDFETLIKKLIGARPNIQYAFCTDRAIALLKKI